MAEAAGLCRLNAETHPPQADGPSAKAHEPFRFYRPELDGLRFFAFLAVFICHASVFASLAKAVLPYSRGLARYILLLNVLGPVGVSLFFCLSSYLITKLMLLEESKRTRVSVAHFYVRRGLRIWPVYFLSLLVLQLWVTPFNLPMDGNALAGFVFFLGNWVMVHLGRLHNCALILWSISVEEQFYLIWPWTFRWFSLKRRIGFFWALIPLAWLIRAALAYSCMGTSDFRFVTIKSIGFACNSFFHLDTFALGALLAVYEKPILARFGNLRWLTVALLSLVLVSPYSFGTAISVLASMGQGLVAFSCMLVVVNSFDTHWLGHPVLVRLGRMTYGLYVYHFFVLRVVEFSIYQGHFPGPDFLPTTFTSTWVAGVGLLATIAVATLSFYGLEQPILKLKGKYTWVLSGKA